MQNISVLNLRFHLIDDNMQLPQICYFLQVVNHVCVLIKICIKHFGKGTRKGAQNLCSIVIRLISNCAHIHLHLHLLGPNTFCLFTISFLSFSPLLCTFACVLIRANTDTHSHTHRHVFICYC